MSQKFRHPLSICGFILLAGCGGGGDSTSDTTSTDPYTGSCGLGNAVYALAAGSTAVASPSITIGTEADRSAFCAQNSGTSITLVTPTIASSATTSSTSSSDLYGLGAAVLAYGSSSTTTTGGAITVSGGTISTTTDGVNGAFATGKGSTVTLANVDIYVSGTDAHAVVAAHSGTATVTGGSSLTSSGAEVVAVEGASTMSIGTSTLVASNATDNHGILIYANTAGAGASTLSMTGGSYIWSSASASAAAFYVYNQTATINLNGVTITNPSTSALLTAASGSVGSQVTINAVGQTLSGNLVADTSSMVTLSLASSSTLSGAVNHANTASGITVTLDATSTWTLTADSYVTVLNDTAGISGTAIANIVGNGHNLYYQSSSNAGLGGATYTLSGGGSLIPY
jgi:hypothetical protein